MQGSPCVFFFQQSSDLGRQVLKPLSHVRSHWDLRWDDGNQKYLPEEDSFAGLLNELIEELGRTRPSERYHEYEDDVARFMESVSIRKQGNRWIGAEYERILEGGGFRDPDQASLVAAAAGRIDAARNRNQHHFDAMEPGHQGVLASLLSVILYHRLSWDLG